MTTNYDHEALTKLATFLSDVGEGDLPDLDTFEMIALLKPFMPGPAFEALATTFDMCPIHLTDLDTCSDDDVLNEPPCVVDTPPLTACRHLRTR
jgi:hypothetical protein